MENKMSLFHLPSRSSHVIPLLDVHPLGIPKRKLTKALAPTDSRRGKPGPPERCPGKLAWSVSFAILYGERH